MSYSLRIICMVSTFLESRYYACVVYGPRNIGVILEIGNHDETFKVEEREI
jgi:hypothetical protein